MKTRAGPGTIRAIWNQALGQTVYNSVQSSSDPVLFSDQGIDYVIPRLLLGYNLLPFPLAPALDPVQRLPPTQPETHRVGRQAEPRCGVDEREFLCRHPSLAPGRVAGSGNNIGAHDYV